MTDMPSFYPTVGRIVHYVAPGSADGKFPPAHRAAIVTEVPMIDVDEWTTEQGNPSLAVFNPQGFHWVDNVPYDPTGNRRYSWHYPERS